MTGSVTRMLHNWKDGDELAAHELDRCLRAELLSLVRSRRSLGLRPHLESEAIVNGAMKSFLSGVRNEEFQILRNREDVKRILAHFAIRALQDRIRYVTSQKRDVRREIANAVGQLDLAADAGDIDSDTSAEALEIFDKFQEVVRQVHKKSIVILEMRLEGLTNEQISRELGMGVRTVQSIIKNMIDKWQSRLETENGNK